MTYRIPVNARLAEKYKIAFPSSEVPSDSYRTPSISAAQEKLIQALISLRALAESHGGYPPAGVNASIADIEESLLLLDESKRRALDGAPAHRLIGAPPTKAIDKLNEYHSKATDRHILRNASDGNTHWFAPAHWNRLKQLNAGLYESLQAKAD